MININVNTYISIKVATTAMKKLIPEFSKAGL